MESIGVLEEAREGEEDESERMDDPTMPQILCVTGGALEEREETEEEAAGGEGEGSWDQGASEIELAAASVECTANPNQQVGTKAVTSRLLTHTSMSKDLRRCKNRLFHHF